jgi:hypothetical protein
VPVHFAPRPFSYLTFAHAGNIFRSLEQELLRAVPGKFARVSNKIKKSGKAAGDSPHGELRGNPGLKHFLKIQ